MPQIPEVEQVVAKEAIKAPVEEESKVNVLNDWTEIKPPAEQEWEVLVRAGEKEVLTTQDYERWIQGRQLKLERGDSSDEEIRDISTEKQFLKSIYPKVELDLIQKLLEKHATFIEVNDALG